MMDERRLKRKALVTTGKITLVWPLVCVQTLDMVLERVHPCENFVTHRAVHFGPVRIMNLQMSLKSVLAVKGLATSLADIFPH